VIDLKRNSKKLPIKATRRRTGHNPNKQLIKKKTSKIALKRVFQPNQKIQEDWIMKVPMQLEMNLSLMIGN